MSQQQKPPAKPALSKAKVANAFSLLTTAPEIVRGETQNVSSFRTSKALAAWLKTTANSVKDETDAKNRAINTLRIFMEESAPHTALFAVYAEEQGIEPVEAIVRLATECLKSKYPQLAERLAGKLKK